MKTPRTSYDFAISGVPHWLMSAGINAALSLLVGAALYVVFYVLGMASSITIPLLLAVVVGMIAYPLVKLGDRAHLPRALSTTIVIVVVLAVAFGAIALTVTSIAHQADQIVEQMATGLQSAGAWLTDFLARTGLGGESLLATVTEYVDALTKALVPANGAAVDYGAFASLLFTTVPLFDMVGNAVSGTDVASILSSLSSTGFSVFIFLVLLFYVLNDYDNIFRWIGTHLGVPTDVGMGLIEDATHSMRGYFTGTTLSAAIISVLTGLGLWALGVPLVIPIVVVTFLTSYIPFIGAIVASAFAILIALGSGGITTALWVIALVVLLNNVIQTIINARLLGDTLNLHAIVVLVATIVGSIFAGLLGATLAAPITATAVRVTRRLREARAEADLAQQMETSGPS